LTPQFSQHPKARAAATKKAAKKIEKTTAPKAETVYGYRKGSSYAAIVQICSAKLGKFIPFAEIRKQVPKIMADSFKDFANKKKVDGDADKRLLTNCQVVCRTDRYGIDPKLGFEMRKERVRSINCIFSLSPAVGMLVRHEQTTAPWPRGMASDH